MKKLTMIGLAGVFALGLTAAALAGGGYGTPSTTTTTTTTPSPSTSTVLGTHSFKATLTGAQEVPKPKAPAGAGGAFTAKTVEAKSADTFTWKLTFHGLSGKAVAAHVHLGKKGVAGGVAISLCGPCKSGQTGTAKITSATEAALKTGKAYVNVHTAKNPGGEIRGQIALAGK